MSGTPAPACPGAGDRRWWDSTIDAWSRAVDLALFKLKANDDRGHVVAHPTGRAVVPVENSPAHSAYALAYRGVAWTLDGVRALLARDEIPAATIFKRD